MRSYMHAPLFPARPTLRPRTSWLLVVVASSMASMPARVRADEVRLPEVQVTGARPVPGLAVPRNEIPAPVQTATDADLRESGTMDLADFMNRHLSSVHVNDIQGNPFQPDVNYRGYTASALLGTPQGLSVYLDGVRLNQPFGDVVSWDLIPKNAIKSVTLIPGSNPLFGLNTLGGALALETKNGFGNPGTAVTVTAGAPRRRSAGLEHGGHNAQGLGWYLNADTYREDGWRDASPSAVQQAFGKLSWRDARSALHLSAAHANNALSGNGLQEQRLLARDWRSVYTKPDTSDNRATLFNLHGMRELEDGLSVSGNVYHRKIVTGTYNGDINEEALDQSLYQLSVADRTALAAAGYQGVPAGVATSANTPFPLWRCVAQALQRDEPAEKCNALINRTRTAQSSSGVAGQATLDGTLLDRRNQLTLGAAYDGSRIDFRQSTQLGYLNSDHGVTGVEAFGDGTSGGTLDGTPYDTRVDLDGRQRTWSVYATDTFSLQDHLHLTLSGRYNHTTVRTRDRITSSGPQSLNGDHRFSRFNPAVGLTYSPRQSINVYAGYNEGTRTPSAIELGCANPEQPCKLPNAMAGDPPLHQVVARTWEAGMRGQSSAALQWNVGLFRASNSDDILFVADDQAGYGYFKNVGKTRRQGLEAGFAQRVGRWLLGAHYTYLEATFESAETVNGASNSSNDQARAGIPGVDGMIGIVPGNRLPLIPRHLLKLNTSYQASTQLEIGLNLLALSGMTARGNENGAHQPDERYYLGPGKTNGYAILNLGARYRAAPRVEYQVQINNLLDRRYTTAAQLGPSGFDAAGNFIARPFAAVAGAFGVQHGTFAAPGAPRLIWIGMRYTFDNATF